MGTPVFPGIQVPLPNHIEKIVIGEFEAPWVKVRVAKLAPIAGVKELGIAIERKRG